MEGKHQRPASPEAPAANRNGQRTAVPANGASGGGITEGRRREALDEAYAVRKMTIPAALSGVVGTEVAGVLGAKFALDSIAVEAGKPSDPVEKMLLEQMVLAHHRLAQLYARADAAVGPEHAKILYGAANRLLGEARRLALAIRAYRAPASPRAFTVVRQQNVASEQTVTFVEHASEAKDSLRARGELGGNGEAPESMNQGDDALQEAGHGGHRGFFSPVAPEGKVTGTGRRRASKRAQAAALE
jgi:hypothetical protein